MDVLKRINQLRLEKGWSVYRLSVESGLPQSTLTNMFNRETLPSITTLECICHAFGISMSEFFVDSTVLDVIDEQEILTLYRALSKDSQKTVTELLKQLGGRK